MSFVHQTKEANNDKRKKEMNLSKCDSMYYICVEHAMAQL